MGFGDFFSGAANIVQQAVAPLSGAGIGGVNFGSIGDQIHNTASGLTPQNDFRATAPLDVAGLQSQLTQSQGNLGQIQGSQGALAQALLAQSQGQGPNPAQAMLNQQTNQNIKQNAGMIASQKGINPALATRLASQNAANMSQQAAGQGAVLGAQQQLAAQGNLANVYGQQANQNLQNASMSGQLANQSSLGAQGITGGVMAQNAAANQNTQSGLMGAIPGIGALFKNKGGEIPKMAGGGQVSASQQIAQGMLQQAGVPYWATGVGKGDVSKGMTGLKDMFTSGGGAEGGGGLMAGGAGDAMGGSLGTGGALEGIGPAAIMAAAHGGSVPKHLHPIAQIYHPNFQAKGTAQLKSKGGDVPGKAKVKGDSPKNDTVKTMLSPGEVVIPRSVMQSDDPVKGAADFVANELKKNGKYSDKDPHGDFKNALKEAVKSRKAA